MINHARTLLLNIPAARVQLQDPGYEYISPTYNPVRLNNALGVCHRTLFGATPDNYFLNVRAQELLNYIHETDLQQYVTALDPRITYWPPQQADFFAHAKTRVDITQTAGPPMALNFGGTFTANNATGTSTQKYDIVFADNASNSTLTTQQTTRPAEPIETEFDPAAAVPVIALPDTKLRFALNLTATTVPPPTTAVLLTETADLIVTEAYVAGGPVIGLQIEPQEEDTYLPIKQRPRRANTLAAASNVRRWQIVVRANPTPVIAELAKIEKLGAPVFLELFGVKDIEPYVTFKNLWVDHPLPPYRLSGFVLALIYRTHELLRGHNV